MQSFGSRYFARKTMTSPLEQKIRITGPVVVTANRVGDGAVVYRRADGGWTTDLTGAAVATDAARARALITDATADELRAVGSYIAPVKLTPDGEVRPGNLRELIRRSGPTIELPVAYGT
jgi:predicted NAD/FAD-binding protein